MTSYRLLFGTIAEEKGYLTPGQVEECAGAQEEMPGATHIGEVALRKGYLDREALVEILTEQILRFTRSEEEPERRLADHIFGQLAVDAGHVDWTDLHEALRQQALHDEDPPPRLGEILVSQGKLTAGQVAELLDRQHVTVLICETCVQPYNVPSQRPDRRYICKVCGSELSPPDDVEAVVVRRAFDELEE